MDPPLSIRTSIPSTLPTLEAELLYLRNPENVASALESALSALKGELLSTAVEARTAIDGFHSRAMEMFAVLSKDGRVWGEGECAAAFADVDRALRFVEKWVDMAWAEYKVQMLVTGEKWRRVERREVLLKERQALLVERCRVVDEVEGIVGLMGEKGFEMMSPSTTFVGETAVSTASTATVTSIHASIMQTEITTATFDPLNTNININTNTTPIPLPTPPKTPIGTTTCPEQNLIFQKAQSIEINQHTPTMPPNPNTDTLFHPVCLESSLVTTFDKLRLAIQALARDNNVLKSSLSTETRSLQTALQTQVTQQGYHEREIEVLEVKVRQLEMPLMIQEPLVEVGAAVRRRFLEKARHCKTWSPSPISSSSLNSSTGLAGGGGGRDLRAGESKEIVEKGNKAAHRGNFMADLSLVALEVLELYEGGVTDIKVVNEIYGIDIPAYNIPKLAETLFGVEVGIEGRAGAGDVDRKKKKEKQILALLDYRGSAAASTGFLAATRFRELERECLEIWNRDLEMDGVADKRGEGNSEEVESKLLKMRSYAERLQALGRRVVR